MEKSPGPGCVRWCTEKGKPERGPKGKPGKAQTLNTTSAEKTPLDNWL